MRGAATKHTLRTFMSHRLFKQSAHAGALCCVLALGGCYSNNDVTGSINPAAPAQPLSQGSTQQYVDELRQRYNANSNDQGLALRYAGALRATGQYVQAVAVIEPLAIRNPNNLQILAAYGKALADAGRFQEAARVLVNAQTPQNPNWSVLSVQGAVADQLGDHVSAQGFYNAALKISPGEPSVLTNLGLSFALNKQLPQAEEVLRQAAASPRADARVRQNLALVLALRGKFDEADAVARQDLSPAQAAANVSAIRSMIAQSDTWRSIQQTQPNAAKKTHTAAASTHVSQAN